MKKALQSEIDTKLDKSSYVIAGAAGVGSGAIAAATSVRREFMDDIKHIPEIKAHKLASAEKLTELWEQAPQVSRVDYLKSLVKTKLEARKELNEILERHHFRSKGLGLLGYWDRSHSMSHNSRGEVFFHAAITAAVAFGGALMFFNNRHTRHQLDRHTQAQDTGENAGRG